MMRCYVWGTNNVEERDRIGRGVLSFAIPDLGIQFRAAHQGTACECEYLALIALLNFAENNPKIFARQTMEACSDAVLMVYQLNGKAPVPVSLERYLRIVRRFQSAHDMSVHWVPTKQNFAFTGVLDLPPVRTPATISLGTSESEKTIEPRQDSQVNLKL